MFVAVSASTVSDLGCARVPAGPLSSVAALRAVIASPPSVRQLEPGRPYQSLRGRGAFARAYREGTRVRCGALTVVVVDGEDELPAVGVVAGRKVGSAVARNRAKRRLREAASRSKLRPDRVYVFIADEEILTAKFSQILQWVNEAVDKAEEKR